MTCVKNVTLGLQVKDILTVRVVGAVVVKG